MSTSTWPAPSNHSSTVLWPLNAARWRLFTPALPSSRCDSITPHRRGSSCGSGPANTPPNTPKRGRRQCHDPRHLGKAAQRTSSHHQGQLLSLRGPLHSRKSIVYQAIWASARELSDVITKEQRDQGVSELDVYYAGVHEHILKPDTEYNLLLLPLGRPETNYRDLVPAFGGEFSKSAYHPVGSSTALGLPQLVIPRSDEDLVQLAAKALRVAKCPSSVLTGKTSFVVDDANDRYVRNGETDSRISNRLESRRRRRWVQNPKTRYIL
ncbi:hypothetical protein B0T10DRAFT_464754 [Thelonectria olida]|uniref:Amidase domain-containing protein n=1 Tax=Thelonectria olida TaxID=1576542 RepID=A0A9P9AKE3_9HYPO|nr:hypothetical protein B0T10DRAFT_464754 [Thelonectria olida]